MSLFGEEDDGLGRSTKTGNDALFGDASADPWRRSCQALLLPRTDRIAVPAPKRKVNLNEVLQGTNIPDQYVDLFESWSVNGLVSLSSFKELMMGAGLAEQVMETIVSIVLPPDSPSSSLSRESFNVSLLLMAMAQKEEDLSIQAVDDRKDRKLPIPKIEASPATKVQIPQQLVGSTTQNSESRPPSAETTEGVKIKPPAPVIETDAQANNERTVLSDPWSPNGSVRQVSHYSAAESQTPDHALYSRATTVHENADMHAISIVPLENKTGLPLWKHVNYE